MGYLVCEKCGGYYKLQKGESPEDFENCQCGGKLSYVDDLEDYPPLNKNLTDNSTIQESYPQEDPEGFSDSQITTPKTDVLYTETIALKGLLIFFIFIFVFFRQFNISPIHERYIFRSNTIISGNISNRKNR